MGNGYGELNQTTRDGKSLIVNSRWTLVRDEAGKPNSVLAINTDITETKKLEQQFLRAQRMESIGTLAGGIAHDLNNVLSPDHHVASSCCKMQLDRRGQPQNMLDIIETSAKRGADMVRQVLSFARGVEGERVAVQLEASAQRDRKDHRARPSREHRASSVDLPHDLWTVQGDPTQLHQVLLNLCVNARDAMPDGGTLDHLAPRIVTLDEHYAAHRTPRRSPGRYVVLQVEDTGTGMPPEVDRQDFRSLLHHQGSGQGHRPRPLHRRSASSRATADSCAFTASSGKGTTFKVYLPAAEAADGRRPAPRPNRVNAARQWRAHPRGR